METWSINLLSIFVLSIILSGIIIPKILLIAFRKKLFDIPDARKIHTAVVPRLGGLAFSPVVIFSLSFIMGINISLGVITDFYFNIEILLELLFELCGLLLLYIIGMADDLIGIRYSAKFFVQIICGLLLVNAGLCINNFHGLFGVTEVPYLFGYLITILVIIFFTNAINLIDGVDGLASGLSISVLLFYIFAFINQENYLYAAVACGMLGVLIPFYYYNVFGNVNRGKKIFMGDTGSLTLGFTLSFLSIKLLSYYQNTELNDCYNPFVLAFVPLFIPCMDVIRVFFRRIRHHKSPFLPDKTHIHHKLMALGLSSRVTMVTIVGVSILLTTLNIYLSKYIDINILLIVNIMLWILINIYMTRVIRKRHVDCDFNK